MTDIEKVARLTDALAAAEKTFLALEQGRIPPTSYRTIIRVIHNALEATK